MVGKKGEYLEGVRTILYNSFNKHFVGQGR